ncbi:MAG: hypothetical protein AAF501_06595, partial [Pseudomonadota bacterium]
RPDALVFEAARVELGFIETTGFVGIASSGDIVKVPDADLLAGQGGNETVDAPNLPLNSGQTAPVINDRIVDTGAAFTNLISSTGGTSFSSTSSDGSNNLLLPHGEASNGDFHNEFGTVTISGPFSNVVLEDANGIAVFSGSFGPIAENVVIRADSDDEGDDGILTAGFDTTGTTTLLTGGDIDASGDFGTGLILEGDNAIVTLFGESPIIDSRLMGDLEIGFSSSGNESDTAQIDVIDTAVGGDLTIVNGVFFGEEGDGESGNEFGQLALSLTPGINVLAERVSVGGDLSISAEDSIGIADVQVEGTAFLGATEVIAERFFVGGDLRNFDNGELATPTTNLSLTDTEIGGNVDFDVSNSVTAQRVRVAGTTTIRAPASLSFSDFVFGGATSLGSAILDFNTGSFATATTFSDQIGSGFSLSLQNVDFGGNLDTGSPNALTFDRVTVAGGLNLVSPNALVSSNISVTGDAVFDAPIYTLSNIDIGGTASFGASSGLTLTDAAFGFLEFDMQSEVTGTRVFAQDGISGTTTGDMTFTDLQAGGTTDLNAGGTLTMNRFILSAATLAASSSVLDNGIASTSFSAPFPSSIISDGSQTLFFSGEPVDFTVAGAGEVLLRGEIAALNDITGPGNGSDVATGIDTNALLGDTVVADRVIGTAAAVDGRSGPAPGASLGTRAPLDDVAVTFDIEIEVPVEIPEEEIFIPIGEIVNNPIGEQEAAVVTIPFFDFSDPVFELPGVDFGTLYSATGNENLWSASTCTEEGGPNCK